MSDLVTKVELTLRRYEGHSYKPPPGYDPLMTPYDPDTWTYVGSYVAWQIILYDTLADKRKVLQGPHDDLSESALLKLFHHAGAELAILANRKVYGKDAANDLVSRINMASHARQLLSPTFTPYV